MPGRFRNRLGHPTHLSQDHAKTLHPQAASSMTSSRRHHLTDDGGTAGIHTRAEWLPHVQEKQRRYALEDIARMRPSPRHAAHGWTSLGHEPHAESLRMNDHTGAG